MKRCIIAAAATIVALPGVVVAQFTPLDSLSPPSSLATPISLRLHRTALRIAVSEIASKARVSIAFDPLLDGLDRAVNIDAANVSAARVLMRTLGDTPLQAMTSTSGSIVLTARPRTERRIVSGTIRQPDGPLSGVHVSLVGTRFETATDVAGRFTFGAVPAGRYGLRAQRMGFAPIDQQIQIGGSEPPLELTMQPVAVPVAAVIVTPGYFGVMQPGLAASQALTRQQIETVPQLGEDVYRAIGRVPGVARDDFSAKFSVRGEPGEGLAVTLDGLPLIEPFHLKDMGAALSIIDLWSLGGAELITGGPSAEVGDEIGGAFRLRTVEARGDRTRGSVGLSLTNVRGGAQGTFANGNGSWLVSARRGYLDLAFKLAQIEDSIKPKYNDGFIKVAYALPGGGRLAAHVLHAGDDFLYRDLREPSVESNYRSDYGWLTLEGRLGNRIRQQSVAWIGDLGWVREGSQSAGNGIVQLRIDDRRSLRTLGVKQDWSIELGSRAMLKVGGVLRRDDASYDYSRLTRRQAVENHVIVTRVDSSSVNIAPVGNRYEAYIAQRVRPVDALTVEAGVRYDRATHTGDAIASPRVNASWQPTRGTTIRGSWGKHAQSQSVFGLQVEDGVRTFSAAERADQLVVGVDQALLHGLAARVEMYDRTTTHVRPRYVNAGSNIVMFPEIANDRLLLAPSSGRSRGVEMTISRDAGRRADWSASYTIASAKQQVNGVWLPRLTDQPRAINADWSFHPIANSWRLSLSAVWHSGWPYTPDLIRVDTIGTMPQTQFAYATFFKGALYSERVPSYQRIDARWTRFIDTRTGRLSFFVEVYNLLNSTNLRDRYTNVSINRTQVTYFNGTRSQLPRIPSFGFNWEF